MWGRNALLFCQFRLLLHFLTIESCLLLRRLRLTCLPAQLVQRRLLWVCHATRRAESELIGNLILPILTRTWHRRTGTHLKMWITKLKENLELPSGPRVFGNAQCRQDWGKMPSELAQDRLAWGASINNASPSHPGWTPLHVYPLIRPAALYT